MENDDFLSKVIDLGKDFRKNNIQNDENYFKNLNKGQSPKILWIGCADSRVDPSEILNMRPGNIFVQRNVANQVRLDDANALSVLEYSVNHLKVDYVIICGHSNCGGVNASCGDLTQLETNLKTFLGPLGDLAQDMKKSTGLTGKDLQEKMYTQNVLNQTQNVLSLTFVQEAMKNRNMKVYPMIFRLDTGLLHKVE